MVDDVDALIARTPHAFRDKQGIDARVLHEVVEIDRPRGRMRVRQLETGRVQWEPFDQLVIATGALPIRPAVPGGNARGIYGVSTLQSGIEIRQAIDREHPRRAVIIGGGYIGLEMAEALVLRGLEVALIDRSPQVMGTLDVDMGALVSEALRNVGVTLYLEESLEGFEVVGERVQAVVTDRRTLPADVVILGMGVQPNAALADEAGIPLGEQGAIRVNERMQTEIEGVWAAGDCVQSYHLVSRRPFHVALGTVANKQGRVAGINIGGGSASAWDGNT